jgi:hypothetical protein
MPTFPSAHPTPVPTSRVGAFGRAVGAAAAALGLLGATPAAADDVDDAWAVRVEAALAACAKAAGQAAPETTFLGTLDATGRLMALAVVPLAHGGEEVAGCAAERVIADAGGLATTGRETRFIAPADLRAQAARPATAEEDALAGLLKPPSPAATHADAPVPPPDDHGAVVGKALVIGVDAGAAEAAIEASLPRLAGCVAGRAGEATLRVALAEDGRVSRATATSPTLPDGSLRCLEEQVGGLRLPAPAPGTSVRSITWPLLFTAR